MLENLSQREKYLAIAAGGLVPIVLLLFGFLWLTSSLRAYDDKIASVNAEINQAQLLQSNQRAATRRLKTYKTLSLPSDPQQAVAEYRNWMIDVSDRIFGKNIPTYETPAVFSEQSKYRDPARPTQPPRKVFNGWRVKINVTNVTLDQLNQFLFEFYRAPILHRIRTLAITPHAGGSGGGKAGGIPTGKLGLLLEIEALALTDAEAAKPISRTEVVRREHELDWYRQQIEHRNIFGLPNNAPQITTGNQSEFEGREVAFNVSARDDDPNDSLKFELLSSDVPGGELKQRDPNSKSAQFTAGEVAPGKYTLRVRVTDSGLPNKNVEKEIALEIKTREPAPEVKPRPPFYHARETQITAILRENDGVDRAWIYIRTLDKRFKVAVGESFEVDQRTWTVRQIDLRTITLECDGKSQTLRVGDKLSAETDDDRYSTSRPEDDSGSQE